MMVLSRQIKKVLYIKKDFIPLVLYSLLLFPQHIIFASPKYIASPPYQSFSENFVIPENPTPSEYSIMTITVKGLNNEGKKTIVKGVSFIIKNEKGQLIAVTNFHIVDAVEVISDMFLEAQGTTAKLQIESISPFYDPAFLRLSDINAERKMKPLEINNMPITRKGLFYIMNFTDKLPKKIQLRYISLMQRGQLNFINPYYDTFINIKGLSGSPVMDPEGRVAAVEEKLCQLCSSPTPCNGSGWKSGNCT